MGLDIGIISITYLDRPLGRAYDFAQELAQANDLGWLYAAAMETVGVRSPEME